MTSIIALRLNAVGLLGLSAVLAFAFADQFLFHDLPCPLCLLQRAGMVAAGFGIALNLATGLRPANYALAIFGALAGGAVSIRQILLHIVPGSGAYGDAFLELHFYTWALAVFVAIIFGTAAMLLFDRQFEGEGKASDQFTLGLARIAFLVFGLMALANGASTILECGAGLCPDNPTAYQLLQDR